MNNYEAQALKPDNSTIISNVTMIAQGQCSETLPEDLKNGVLYMQNTKGGVFNSIISGWEYGLMLDGNQVLANADNGTDFYFAENTFFKNNTDYEKNGTWPGSCADFFEDWITGSGDVPCEQLGNQFNTTAIGYSPSLCDSFCTSRPVLTINPLQTGYNMSTPNYSSNALNNVFFEELDFRGAFDAVEDWTADWANFCPQTAVYCSPELMKTTIGVNLQNSNLLKVYPNPAKTEFSMSFTTTEGVRAAIHIVDYSGRIVYEHNFITETAYNSLSIPTQNWAKGIYFVNLNAEGKTQTAKLVIE